jgi:hypothetical protein
MHKILLFISLFPLFMLTACNDFFYSEPYNPQIFNMPIATLHSKLEYRRYGAAVEPKTWCYKTIGQMDCYSRVKPSQQYRLNNVENP